MAATITNSQIVEDHAQANGERRIRERHTDSLGRVREFAYTCDAEFDEQAAMTSRASGLIALLAGHEIEQVLGAIASAEPDDVTLVVPTLDYATNAAAVAVLKDRYQGSKSIALLNFSFVVDQIGDNGLKNLFGLNDAQLASFRTKLAAKIALREELAAMIGDV